MSVQLIVYPQSFDGSPNPLSNPSNQYLVDAVNFDDVNLSTQFISYLPSFFVVQDAINNYDPIINLNTWGRFYEGSVGNVIETLGRLVISPTGSQTPVGILQKLSNLVVGAVYNITVDVFTFTGTTGNFECRIYSGTILQSNQVINAVSGQTVTIQFTANTSEDTIVFSGKHTSTTIINSISILAAANQPSGVVQNVENGQVICDLYEDEDIPLSLSVDNFKNVAEKVQSYSKAFNLPATKRNNQIFNQMYEVTRTDDGIIFNPYVKTQCILKQDGFILFEGYLRMIDISDKEGEISYNVNLYSETIALIDFLTDKTFSELDFTELEHLYNYTNIKNSWNGTGTGITYINTGTSGFRDANLTVKYPFVDWSHQYTYNSTSNPQLPDLESSFRPFINIKYLIDRIFNQPDFPFTYSSTLFDTLEFKNLYMDFNWGSDSNPNDSSSTNTALYQITDTISYAPTTYGTMTFPSESFSNNADWGYSTGIFTCPAGNQNAIYELVSYFRFQAIEDDTLSVRWVKNLGTATELVIDEQSFVMEGTAYLSVEIAFGAAGAGALTNPTILNSDHVYSSPPTVTFQDALGSGAAGVVTIDGSGNIDSFTLTSVGNSYTNSVKVVLDGVVSEESYYTVAFSETLNPGDTLQPQFKAASGATNIIKKKFATSFSANNSVLVGSINIQGMTTNHLLQTLRGELGQWDFLKGIMTMFNIVTLPDKNNPNNIKFETYSNTFIANTAGTSLASRSVEHDWTDKVDVAEIKLTPLIELNKETIFKFVEDDDDYAFSVYKQSNNHLYGSKIFDASGFTILQGKQEVIAEPFAATLIKPLMEQFPEFITPAIYGLDDDGVSSSFDNSPRIMFNNGIQNLVGCSFDVPEQNDVAEATGETAFLQFSHLTEVAPTTGSNDFHFGECQLIGVASTTLNNLFNLYWLPYYSELYNADTRVMSIKVNLSPSDINTFEFNDLVMIKNRTFRVNKIDYKPNDLATVEFILLP